MKKYLEIYNIIKSQIENGMPVLATCAGLILLAKQLEDDDTVHLGDKVNTILMMFLYQAKNQGKNIVLLSRHSKDIHSSLKDFHISEELFSDIIVIDNDKPKSSYIVQKSAIFIDDAFSERYDVSRVCGIPVFDCSEVEALLDWRV